PAARRTRAPARRRARPHRQGGSALIRRASPLPWLAYAVVALAAVPLAFVAWQGVNLSADAWRGLVSARIPGLLANTLGLAFYVAVGALALGVSTAWLVARREFPGRHAAVWLMVLPLAIPTYVFAYLYGELAPWLHGMTGAVFVLSLAGFPYVFLLTRAALESHARSLDDAARCGGCRPLERFMRVT